MARLTGDLRWAWRQAIRRPMTACAVAATLAVAIGAVTVAAGLASAVLWRPLPLADADRVVLVWEETGEDARREPSRVTGSRYADWRDHATTFQSLALFGAAGFSLEGADGVTSIRGVRVSGAYFETLGLAPLVGRGFTSDDEAPGRDRVVVLSHALWQQRFGGRFDAVGQSLRLSGEAYTIVGVMPPLVLPAWPVNPATVTLDAEARQVWVPIPRTPDLDQSARSHVFGVIGRLAPGVTPALAQSDLARLTSPTAPDPHGARVRPLREELVRSARQGLLVLLGAALAVLLVACTNLAALQAAAFEARRVELATRAALGAGTGTLVGQLATEALMMGTLGGVTGLLLARAALSRLPAWLPPSVPMLTEPGLDPATTAVGLALAVLASLALAAWPIGRLMMDGPMPRGTAARPRPSVYRVLVTAQVAVAVALVASASLLGRSLWTVQATDPGFLVDGVVVADVSLPDDRFGSPADLVPLEDRLVAGVGAPRAVTGVALAYDHPLEANWTDGYRLLGDAGAPDEPAQAQLRIVSPGYFDTLGVDVLDGRAFAVTDRFDGPGVALVNEAFARRVAGSALGRQIRSAAARRRWGETVPTDFTIVGVVENERFRGLEEPSEPAVYLSTRQFPQQDFALVVRTSGDARALAADVNALVRGIEPQASLRTAVLLRTVLGDQLAARRVTTNAVGAFAALALLMAALGLHAVLALFVASRTRELGVRIALGATPRRVASRVVGESLAHVTIGLAAGVLLAVGTGRLLEGLLVGVTGRDPLTLIAVVGTMAMAAALASVAPVVRATRVDPVVALNAE